MDHYPEVTIAEREYARSDYSTPSRHDSASSLKQNGSQVIVEQQQLQPDTTHQHHHQHQTPQYTSFPSLTQLSAPSTTHRTDSSTSSSSTSSTSSHQKHSENEIDLAYSRYIDAPPPYSAAQYAGKTEAQCEKMKMSEYAREISRVMSRQLVRGLKMKGNATGSTQRGKEGTISDGKQ